MSEPAPRRRPSALPVFTTLAAFGVVAAAVWLTTGASRPAAPAGDAVQVDLSTGRVDGVVSADATVTVTVTGTGPARRRTTRSNGYGRYAVTVRSGGSAIHDGDVVTVVDGRAHVLYREPVRLVGYLDEDTGRLDVDCGPFQSATVRVFTNGTHARLVLTRTVVGTATGRFTVPLAATPAAGLARGHFRYRGFVADVAVHTGARQTESREIQTPNLTLVGSRGFVSGGYLRPGDHATFTLLRADVPVARETAVADADGLATATLPVPVADGDVLAMSYHDPVGRLRTLALDPWRLLVTVDPGEGAVVGRTGPGVVGVVIYEGPTRESIHHLVADTAGRFRVPVPDLVGDRLVVVWRVADPTGTGVGIQQVEALSPQVRLQDQTDVVSGVGPPRAGPVTVDVVRGGVVVVHAAGVATAAGRFRLRLPDEVVPGDLVRVDVAGQALPGLAVGDRPLSATLAPDGRSVAGTGAAGREVTVRVAGCVGRSVVPADGRWRVAVRCRPRPDQVAVVTETLASGPAAGSFLFRYVVLGAPVVTLVTPGPDAVLSGRVPLEVLALDGYTGRPADRVELWLDGRFVADLLARGRGAFVALLPLPPGPHRLAVVALADGLAASTPTRHLTVR